jgi:hypothetical protein
MGKSSETVSVRLSQEERGIIANLEADYPVEGNAR